MRITTLKQLKSVKPSETLWLINPYGNGDQSRVTCIEFKIKNVNEDFFSGLIKHDICESYERKKYFSDLLQGCKYVFTNLMDSNKALADIKGGLHHDEVKAHHDEVKAHYDRCKRNGM